MSHPILKVVGSTGCQSYIVGCPTTRKALLIDPKVGQEASYRRLLSLYGLTLDTVLDTHTHADHLSATSRFIAEGANLAMSALTQCARPKRDLRAGDQVELGSLRFGVREVPGHTADSIALVGHGAAFTGDSLMLGGLARADFRGSDPALLFESVKNQLMTLPDETLVFPGHSYGDLLFSSIGRERASNSALQHTDGAAYATSLGAVEGEGNSDAVDEMLRMNLEADPELPESPSNVATCCASPGAGPSRASIPEVDPEGRQEDLERLASQAQWIDVRDPFEFEHGHIPGTRNIPLGELGFHLEELRAAPQPLYISCRSGVRSMTACRTLQHLGVVAESVNVGGGILRWQELGFPIVGEPAT